MNPDAHAPFFSEVILLWGGGILAVLAIIVLCTSLLLRLTPANHPEIRMGAGERQLWVGTPVQGISYTRALLDQAFMGVIFVIVALLLIILRPEVFFGDPYVALLLGGPFIGHFLYYTFVDSFKQARRRKRTVYVLTTKRAIVSVGATVRSYDAAALRGSTLADHGDGTGTIYLGPAMADLERQLETAATSGSPLGTRELKRIERAERIVPRFDRIQGAPGVLAIVRRVADREGADESALRTPQT